MASLESLRTRAALAKTQSGVTVDDKSLAMEIVHVSEDYTTPVVTLVSATGITLANSGYTTGSLAFSTYTTLGSLVDIINNSHFLHFKARIIDGLRTETTETSELIPNSAITATTRNGEDFFEVFLDQSVTDSMYFRVSADRGVLKDDDSVLKTQKPGGSHRVTILGIKYQAQISAATKGGIRIFEYSPVGDVETQIYEKTSVDNTATTIDFTDSPITAEEGNDLIVEIADSAITDATTNFLQVDYVRE